MANYERLSQGVVPRSAEVIPVKQDIGQVELIRVVVVKKYVEDIKSKCKSELKVLMREFEWDISSVMAREAMSAKLDKDSTKSEADLKMVCEQSFKDVYAAYAHCRMLKVVIDSTMTFGDDYKVFMMRVYKGKDRKVLQTMVNRIDYGASKDMYGFKEDQGEEDSFPFCYSHIELGIDD